MKQEQIDQKLSALKSSIFRPIAPLAIEAWVTPKPVPYAERRQGEHKIVHVGDRWGQRVFDCGWFHFTGTIPVEYRNQDVVIRIDINGELCLMDEQGQPVRGLTAHATAVPSVNLGGPLKSVYQLPRATVQSGTVDLWGDAGLNELFGGMPGSGAVMMAEVAVVDMERRALFYDLEVIGSLLVRIDHPSNASYRRYRRVFEDAIAEADIGKARAICKTILDKKDGDALMTITAVGHSHLDLAWLWPIRETIRKAARTFSTALYNIERYPDYVFGASQPQQFDWMKQFYPGLFERIRSAVKAGRIEPQGCMWVEADMNVAGGEALVRQMIYGCRFFREEFDVEMNHLWLPDVFGYNGQLPQILKKAGMNYFVTQKLSWNKINQFPYHSFRWRGIDGSEVLAHTPPENTYNSHATLLSISKIQDEYKQIDVSNHALMLYGIGDGGGGPDAEHLERLAREKNLPGLPQVITRGAVPFFAEWSKESARFPIWQGELYLECHQGTFTSQSLTKKNNRRCEGLLREVEWSSLLAEQLCGVAAPDLQQIWQEVLLYQFHDILPGSSIHRVYVESNERYLQLIVRLESLLHDRYRQLANTLAAAKECVLFNSLPWPRTEWVKDQNSWTKVEVPPMGYAVVRPSTPAAFAIAADNDRLENALICVRFAADGTIRSLYNKTLQREMILANHRANQFAVYADYGNAWDMSLDYRSNAPQRPVLETVSIAIDGPRAVRTQTFRVGESTIIQRILLTDGSPVIEFDTELDWNDPLTMLRVEFPVAVHSETARYEIQFGEIERTTHTNTMWDVAKDEVPHQQWMDLSQADCGLALMNDSKYGARIKDQLMELNLLRCVPTPTSPQCWAKHTSERVATATYTDLGPHHFRYAAYAHDGRANVVPQARIFNSPIYGGVSTTTTAPATTTAGSWITLDDARIDVPAVKKAEDGRGWIVRLVMTEAATANVTLQSKLAFSQAEEVDLLERPIAPIPVQDGAITTTLHPYEIKTIRLSVA